MSQTSKAYRSLMSAIDDKDHPKIERLLNDGANPNFYDKNENCTLLHLAVDAKDPISIEILLRKGAKHDTINGDGKSAWDLAQEHAELKAVFENHFPPGSLSVSDPLEQPQETVMYDRRSGTLASLGQKFESYLLALILYRLLKDGYEFLLGFNINGVGVFDDICFKYRKAGEERFKFVFIQAKHRENPEKKKITNELLFYLKEETKNDKKKTKTNKKETKNDKMKTTTNEEETKNDNKKHEKDDCNIQTIFPSYLRARERFGNTDEFFTGNWNQLDIELIFYTNAISDVESDQSTLHNDLLKTSDDGKLLKIDSSPEIIQTLCGEIDKDIAYGQDKRSNKRIFENICENENIQDKEGFKKKLAEDYLKKLKIYCHQSNQNQVQQKLEKALQEGSSENSQVLCVVYLNLVQKYCETAGKVEFLTKSCPLLEQAKQITADKLLENLTDSSSKDVKSYDLEYSEEAFKCPQLSAFCNNPDGHFINIHSKAAMLSFVKLSQYFKKRFSESLAIIDYDKVYNEWGKILRNFLDLNKFKHMIVYCVEKKSQLQEQLQNISGTKCNKKIIIVSDEHLQGLETLHDTRNSLAYLTPECQKQIMSNKKITFQNKTITLTELMNGLENTGQLIKDFISGEILLKILREDTVEIAKLSAKCLLYFVKRGYFLNKIDTIRRYYRIRRTHIFENSVNIDSVDSFKTRIVIIAAEPGMGKSTILTHLSSNSDFLWIVRFNLLDYTKQLRKTDQKQSQLKVAIEFLLHTLSLPTDLFEISNDGLKLINFTLDDLQMLEAKVFEMCYNQDKIVVFADGFDEIAPHYVESALHILKGLKESKIHKLIVTTRDTNAKDQLEKGLEEKAFYLNPFTKEDAQEFFKLYWKVNLNVTEINDGRIKSFFYYLYQNCEKAISTDSKGFLGVPLHIEMIASCVQDTFEKFHETGDHKYMNELKTQLNLVSLYRSFYETKFSQIYFAEKLKTQPDNPLNLISKDEYMEKHRRLALYALFVDKQLEILLPDYNSKWSDDLKSIEAHKENLGFVSRVVDNKPQFTHLTYAEFPAAEIIWKTYKETSTEDFETFAKVVLIDSLAKNDRKQIFQFLKEFALEDLNNSNIHITKLGLLIEILSSSSHAENLGLIFDFVYCYMAANSPEFWQHFDNLPKSKVWKLFELCVKFGHEDILRAINGRISQKKMKMKLAEGEWKQSPLLMTLKSSKSGIRNFIPDLLVHEFGYNLTWQDRSNRTLFSYLLENKLYKELKSLIFYLPQLANTFTNNILPVYQMLRVNAPEDVITECVNNTTNESFNHKYMPNISWFLLNYEQPSTLHFLSSFSQMFLFENSARHDNVYHKDSNYFDKLLRPSLFDQMESLNIEGNGFYLEIIEPIRKWTVIMKAISIEHEDCRNITKVWIDFIVTNANEVCLNAPENGKITISINGKQIDVTRWIDKPTNIQFSNDIDYIKSAINFQSDFQRTEQLKRLMSEITSNGAEDLFFRYLSSNHSLTKKQLDDYGTRFNELLNMLEQLRSKYDKLLNAIKQGLSEVSDELQKIPERERKTVINSRDKKFGSPLLYATACGKLEIAQKLLEEGANPNIRLELVNDASFDDLDEVFCRVKEFGNVTPLHIAAFLGYLEFVKYLLDFNGPELDLRKLLLRYGGDDNDDDDDHYNRAYLEVSTPYTSLHLAAREGHKEVVRYLVEHGARIDAIVDESNCDEYPFPVRNIEGGCYTALSLAEKYRHQDVVDLLKSFQPTAENGFTALHRAAASNDLDSARILIKTGEGDINSVTRYNDYTPLHVAAENGNPAIAHHLLRKGADKNAKSRIGKTPWKITYDRGHGDVVKVFWRFQQSELNHILEHTLEPD